MSEEIASSGTDALTGSEGPDDSCWIKLFADIIKGLRGFWLFMFGMMIVCVFALLGLPFVLKGILSEGYIFAILVLILILTALSFGVVVVFILSKKK